MPPIAWNRYTVTAIFSVAKSRRRGHSNGRRGIYIPAGLINDSAFPFKNGETLTIKIDGQWLIIEKARKAK
jgi:hypothetical protein